MVTENDSQEESIGHEAETSSLVRVLRLSVGFATRLLAMSAVDNHRVTQSLRRLDVALGKLQHIQDDDFIHALEKLATEGPQGRPSSRARVNPRELRDMPLNRVEELVSDPTTTKQDLLAIAKERFGASTGTLVKLARPALTDRLQAFVMNERGHTTVARLAAGEPRLPSQPPEGGELKHKEEAQEAQPSKNSGG